MGRQRDCFGRVTLSRREERYQQARALSVGSLQALDSQFVRVVRGNPGMLTLTDREGLNALTAAP